MSSAKGPGQSALLLLDVVSVLNRRKIPYAIVGAFAASFHGVVRASMDADAVISLGPDREAVDGLREAFSKAGLKSAIRRGERKDPIGAVIHVEDRFKNRVDLLVGVRGMPEDVFARAVESEFMNRRIRVIDAEDFIAMKVFAGGPRDIEDAEGVLRISGARLKRDSLKRSAEGYGKAVWERLKSLLKAWGAQK